MCILFYFSVLRLSVRAFAIHSMHVNLSFKTTMIKQNMKIILAAGVPSSQALTGFLITAPPYVCVPDVIGALACGFQTKKSMNRTHARARGRLLLDFLNHHSLIIANDRFLPFPTTLRTKI